MPNHLISNAYYPNKKYSIKIADTLLTPARIAFGGRKYSVMPLIQTSDHRYNPLHHRIAKVALRILCIFATFLLAPLLLCTLGFKAAQLKLQKKEITCVMQSPSYLLLKKLMDSEETFRGQLVSHALLGGFGLIADSVDLGLNNSKTDYILNVLLWNKEDCSRLNLHGNYIEEKGIRETVYTPLFEISYPKKGREALAQMLEHELTQNTTKRPKKIFIPTAAKRNSRHAILMVIEPHPTNLREARITFIDSLGNPSSYTKHHKALLEGALDVYSEHASSVVYNQVKQQRDQVTCGFQQILNIVQLADIDNVQEFVRDRKLTFRSKTEIEAEKQFWTSSVITILETLAQKFPHLQKFSYLPNEKSPKLFVQTS